MAGDLIVNLGDANFKEFISKAQIPVLVDFWADWCGPCKMLAPILEDLAGDYKGKVQVAKVNVDQNKVISSDFEVSSIPMLVIFKGGAEAGRFIGFKNKKDLSSILDNNI